jgi:hypothetical protein
MIQATSIKSGRPRSRFRGRRTWFSLAVLIAFFVVVYFLVPDAIPQSLPIFFQRLIGLVNASLAMVTAMFAVREYGRGYNRIRLPRIGSIRTSAIVGGIVFVAVFAWWFTPWAPIAAIPMNP